MVFSERKGCPSCPPHLLLPRVLFIRGTHRYSVYTLNCSPTQPIFLLLQFLLLSHWELFQGDACVPLTHPTLLFPKHFLILGHHEVLYAHLVPISALESAPLQRSLVLLFENEGLDSKTGCCVGLSLLGCHCYIS